MLRRSFTVSNPIFYFTNLFKRLFSSDRELYRAIYNIFGFYPNNINFFKVALIHKSASETKQNGTVINNERLEYLGDAVLDAVVADYLYNKYPFEYEGFLTQMRSRMVNGEKLNELANKMNISDLIRSNTSQTTNKKHINEDAFEALIGAIYLDVGYRATAKIVINRIINFHVDLNEILTVDRNYKSQLIEWAQKNKQDINFNTTPSSKNNRSFVCKIVHEDKVVGFGSGTSKKQSEQEAAKVALEKIRRQEENVTPSIDDILQ